MNKYREYTAEEFLRVSPLRNQKDSNGQGLVDRRKVKAISDFGIERVLVDSNPVVVFRGREMKGGILVKDHAADGMILEGHHRQAALRVCPSLPPRFTLPVLEVWGDRTTEQLEWRGAIANDGNAQKSFECQALSSDGVLAAEVIRPIYGAVKSALPGYRLNEVYKITFRLAALMIDHSFATAREQILHGRTVSLRGADLYRLKRHPITNRKWIQVSAIWSEQPQMVIPVQKYIPGLMRLLQPGFNVLNLLRDRSSDYRSEELKANIIWPILGLAFQNRIGEDISETVLAKRIQQKPGAITRKLSDSYRNNPEVADVVFAAMLGIRRKTSTK